MKSTWPSRPPLGFRSASGLVLGAAVVAAFTVGDGGGRLLAADRPTGEPTRPEPVCPSYDEGILSRVSARSPSTGNEVGVVATSQEVDAMGTASVVMPLDAPVGRGGLQPHLALRYSSDSGNGHVGVGFHLDGFGAITRCGSNFADDDRVREIRYDAEDHFCFEGRRLVATQGEYGKNGTRYVTVPDSFARITSYAPEGVVTKFTIERPEGQIETYGGAWDARATTSNGQVREWHLSRIEDRSGNYATYEYISFFGGETRDYVAEIVPSRVRYTGHASGLEPNREVAFDWEQREDTGEAFTRGMRLTLTQRLKAIRMLVADEEVKRYELSYTPSSLLTRRSLLDRVTERGVTEAKPSTVFRWEAPFILGQGIFEPLPTFAAAPKAARSALMQIDVNADGHDDLVYSDYDSGAGVWMVALGGVGTKGFGVPKKWATTPLANGQEGPPPGVPFDWDLDGKMDVLVYATATTDPMTAPWNKQTLKVLRSTGVGFEVIDTGVDNRPFLDQSSTNVPPYPPILGDFDGNGAVDVMLCDVSSGGAGLPRHNFRILRHVSFGGKYGFLDDDGGVAGAAPVEGNTAVEGHYKCNAPPLVLDVNGDGADDILRDQGTAAATGGTWEIVPTGLAKGELKTAAFGQDGNSWRRSGLGTFVVDVNGDGLPDIVQGEDSSLGASSLASPPRLYVNTGTGFTKSFLPAPPQSAYPEFASAVPIDLNQDGRTDFLVPPVLDGQTYQALVATPSGYELHATSIPLASRSDAEVSQEYRTDARLRQGMRGASLDGVGPVSVVGLIPSAPNQPPVLGAYRNMAPNVDRLTAVYDGLATGVGPGHRPRATFTYGPLARRPGATAEPTYAPSTGCSFPSLCYAGSKRVVTDLARDTGADGVSADGLLHERFTYEDARFHRQGRGFLGFAKITRTVRGPAGVAQRRSTVTEFDNATFDPVAKHFTGVGVPRRQIRRAGFDGSSTGVASVVDASRAKRVTAAGKSFFVFTDSTRRRQWDVPGSAPADTVPDGEPLSDDTSTVEVDDVHNVVSASSASFGVPTMSSTRTFEYRDASWLMRLVTGDTACSTEGDLTYCRSSTTEYDARGLVTRTVVGPEDPTKALSNEYRRDDLGNVTFSTMTGGGAVRRACVSFDDDATFPFATRNDEGHLTVEQYDRGNGQLAQQIAPDGTFWSWRYDGLGRLLREQHPDGTATTYVRRYLFDGGANRDEKATHLVVTAPDGREVDVELDTTGRVHRAYGWVLSDGQARRTRTRSEYDAYGRVVLRTIPTFDDAPESSDVIATAWRYDGADRVIQVKPHSAKATTTAYPGRDIVTTDARGNVSRVVRDGRFRIAASVDALLQATTYAYGPFDQLRAVTDPAGNTTSFDADSYGRRIAETHPDAGTTTMEYDAFDQVVRTVDGNGDESRFAYDRIGRTTRRSDPTGITEWRWDTAPNGVGKLARTVSPDGIQQRFEYDDAGRLSATTLEIHGEELRTALGYDARGRVERITYPDVAGAFSVRHLFDDRAGMLGVLNDETGVPLWKRDQVDASGRTLIETFGNQVSTSRQYVADVPLVRRIDTGDRTNVPLQKLRYAYDDNRNVVGRSDLLQAKTSGTEVFVYDALDRLVQGQQGFNGAIQYEYAYDGIGNLTHKKELGPLTYHPSRPHAVLHAGTSPLHTTAQGACRCGRRR